MANEDHILSLHNTSTAYTVSQFKSVLNIEVSPSLMPFAKELWHDLEEDQANCFTMM